MTEARNVQVKLSDIKWSPCRRLDLYPLDKSKIEKLRASIKETGFWRNVVARKKGRYYELAYGHHRIEAARQELGKDATIPLNVSPLSDEQMLKYMALDNDDAYKPTTGSILETVSAVKYFIQNDLASGGSARTDYCFKGESSLCHAIHTFIPWPQKRVQVALAHLAAIDNPKGGLSKTAIELCPNQEAAEALHHAVKKSKAAGKPITQKTQVAIAKKATKQSTEAPTKVIEQEVRARIYAPEKLTIPKHDEFLKLIQDGASRAAVLDNILKSLLKEKRKLYSPSYRYTIEATALAATCHSLVKNCVELFRKEGKIENRNRKKLPGKRTTYQ